MITTATNNTAAATRVAVDGEPAVLRAGPHPSPDALAFRCGVGCSSAEPLDPDDEHEVIWRVDQERDEALVVLAEMQRAQ